MAKSKDLFDDSTMSFGDHLESLRLHMFKAIIGVAVGMILCLIFGDSLVAVVRSPIDQALTEYWDKQLKKSPEESGTQGTEQDETDKKEIASEKNQIVVEFRVGDLLKQLPSKKKAKSEKEDQAPEQENEKIDPEQTIQLVVTSEMFRQFEQVIESRAKLKVLTAEEAFMVYLKVSLIGGLILTSPWVFFQIWQFVAAGLYPHEQKYVYYYLPISIVLFLSGVFFCFFAVFPMILGFLLSFNEWLGFEPQLRVSDWISFAVMMPLMFGISFQLPLVMLFLEKISIFEVKDFREKRRISVLVIAVVSMLMTPSDPWSMLAMMVPLVLLYELGIIMCGFSPHKKPFEGEELD